MSLSGVGNSPGLMQALSISASGVQAGTLKLNVASNNIANANTPGFTPDRVASQAVATGGVTASVETGEPVPEAEELGISSVDMVTELVNVISAGIEVKANAKVMKTLDQATETLIDVAG